MDAHPLRLTSADAPRLQALRAEALVTDPWAFGATPDEDSFRAADFARATLADPQHAFFAVEHPDRGRHHRDGPPALAPLIAMAIITRAPRSRQSHTAVIWGIYTTPGFRRRGLSRALVNACITHAPTWPGVERITLSVSDRTPNARALYESLGFITWGTEPDCVRIGPDSAAEHQMHLRL
jgi:RimJ/RimL family protein N-acetyltransferase